MKYLPNVLTLQILLHSYSIASPFEPDPRQAPAVKEAFSFLLREDLIKLDTDKDDVYRTTNRANALIRHIMGTPLPEQHWLIPERLKHNGKS